MSEADMKLAVTRANMLFSFYCAERRAGADPLTANQRMAEFAKRIDAESPFITEQQAIQQIRESVS